MLSNLVCDGLIVSIIKLLANGNGDGVFIAPEVHVANSVRPSGLKKNNHICAEKLGPLLRSYHFRCLALFPHEGSLKAEVCVCVSE